MGARADQRAVEREPLRADVRALAAADLALPTREFAARLLGAVLAHETQAGLVAGRVVEVEAYLAGDAASHSFRGPTRRNASMFGPPGRAYVYLCYGVHTCFNVVTAPRGVGEAVLVRALEPVAGLELMRGRRGVARDLDLCRGPGRLCAALGIGLGHDGQDLQSGPLRLWLARVPEARVASGPRIGITRDAELPLRFARCGSPHVSRPIAAGARGVRARTASAT